LPNSVGVSSAEPLPTEAKSKACALQISDAQAAEGDRPADALPVHMTLPSIGLRTPGPKEATFNSFNLLDYLFVQLIYQQLVDWYGIKD
jgi:hypothetical protein